MLDQDAGLLARMEALGAAYDAVYAAHHAKSEGKWREENPTQAALFDSLEELADQLGL